MSYLKGQKYGQQCPVLSSIAQTSVQDHVPIDRNRKFHIVRPDDLYFYEVYTPKVVLGRYQVNGLEGGLICSCRRPGAKSKETISVAQHHKLGAGLSVQSLTCCYYNLPQGGIGRRRILPKKKEGLNFTKVYYKSFRSYLDTTAFKQRFRDVLEQAMNTNHKNATIKHTILPFSPCPLYFAHEQCNKTESREDYRCLLNPIIPS